MALTPLYPVIRPIETALFDFFKTGPGPSSSHTMGPMSAGYDFMRCCNDLDANVWEQVQDVRIHLFGSLSATGKGHGTHAAVLAGLMGHDPAHCPEGFLGRLSETPDREQRVRLGEKSFNISIDQIVDDAIVHNFPYSNTLIIKLVDTAGNSCFEKEYYSVGGGFIQWKGWTLPERGTPVHPYGNMRQLRERLDDTGLTLHELMLENESAITGAARPAILSHLDAIMEAMYQSVERGLGGEGLLPGTLGVSRKAKGILASASRVPHAVDRFLGRINAYAFAASEENASGGVIVTAPTCGAAGVMPSLLYAMRENLNIGGRALREGVLASAAVGFLAKHNAGIAGAEVGCQGEVGVASAMGAAMLAHARGNSVAVVENAAEIALEHHLGLTCDPVGGYVQIPCIERNAVGAIKAYNACLLATCEDSSQHIVTLDAVIRAMGETGREMNAKYKETSEGGLAVSLVEC